MIHGSQEYWDWEIDCGIPLGSPGMIPFTRATLVSKLNIPDPWSLSSVFACNVFAMKRIGSCS